MANVLLLNGSPHAHGAIDLVLNEVAKTLQECGLTTEIVHVGQQDIRGCIACGRCGVLHRCVFDDAVNDLAPKFETADALIVGSPVYYASANGTLTNLLDRLFYSTAFDKTMKVGATVVSCRRGGASATFDQLNKYFTISGMPVASSQYWNSIHGNNAQEAAQDAEGLQELRRHVVYLSPAGRVLNQTVAEGFARDYNNLILLCGHYEGVDQRIVDEIVDEEISIGDFVLTGGEIPACILTDCVARLVPGVLADPEC